MPFTTEELSTLESLLTSSDGGLQMVAAYRSQFPGRSLTRCDASDMSNEVPFKQFTAIDLYLVDGRDHCWHITHDPQQATGVVVAKRKDNS
jgi:hypothetical protein